MGIGIGFGIGMGIGTGAVRCVRNVRVTTKSNVRRYEILNADGTVACSFSVRTGSKSSKSAGRLKRLPYNFKKISAQILKSKTSGSARKAVSSARRQVAQLKRKLYSSEYDDSELKIAITHAEKIERVARKRMKHLQEEERAKKGGVCEGSLEEQEELDELEALEKEESAEALSEEQKELEEAMRQSMEEAMEAMQEAMEENMDELMKSMDEMLQETGLEELSEELTGVKPDMDPKDLEDLKRKHRLDEMKDIAEADAKYLKALFNKLQSDRQNVSSNIAMSGVSLELGGVEMTFPEPAPAPVSEGGSVDVSV